MAKQLFNTEKLLTQKNLHPWALSAGVAHEINNPIAVILGFAELLLERIFHIRTSSILIVSAEHYFLFMRLFSFFLVATCVSR